MAILKRLMNNPEEPIADRFESVSILFAGIVGFTAMSDTDPVELVTVLTKVISAFDAINQNEFGLTKIKTIGDCYMSAAGLPSDLADHAVKATECGLGMIARLKSMNPGLGRTLGLRVGTSTGPVVAGLIRAVRRSYDVWGDTVDVASRMGGNGVANKVQVSQGTYDAMSKRGNFSFEPNEVNAKGKGLLKCYIVSHNCEPHTIETGAGIQSVW